MAKFKLEFEEEYPYVIIGINSTETKSRLCWSLNIALDIALRREEDLELIGKNKDSTFHAFYRFEDEKSAVHYRLIENHKRGNWFLPDASRADVVFVIDEAPHIQPDEFLKRINAVRSVILAFSINLDLLKSKQNLLLTA